MIILAALIAIVVGATVYVGAQAKPDPLPSPKVEAGPGGVAIGGDVRGSTITVAPTSGGEARSK